MKSWTTATWFPPLLEGQSLHVQGDEFKAATQSFMVEVTATADQGYIVRCNHKRLNDSPYLLVIADNLQELGQAVLATLADARLR